MAAAPDERQERKIFIHTFLPTIVMADRRRPSDQNRRNSQSNGSKISDPIENAPATYDE